jgi:hypothetical protein
MMLANATNLNRKSGVAEWRDLQFAPPVTDLVDLEQTHVALSITA